MIALCCLTVGCATAGEKWGPFKGQIVDVETGQGIEGAVVLVIWDKYIPNPVGTSTEFFDVREAVTGPDGRFEVPRRDPPFFTLTIREPDFKVFAPGYEQVRWLVTPEGGEVLVEPTIVEMRKLRTRAERIGVLREADSGIVPAERRCLLTRAVNRERVNLGLGGQYPECER
jgi:hypothetical protein